jgi:hypothetical protein
VTKFSEVFLTYHLHQVSDLIPDDDDDDDDDNNQDCPQNISSVQTPDMADSPRRLYQRMCGAIPLLPQYIFMALCLINHRDNCTFIM